MVVKIIGDELVQLFDKIHVLVIISVGPIPFTLIIFLKMFIINTFVSEIWTKGKYFFKTTTN